MSVRKIMMRTATMAGLVLWCASVMAQTPAPPSTSPRVSAKQTAPPPSPVSQRATEKRGARQVVTVVHRINGLKMFRFLLRSQQQVQGVAALDSTFNLREEVHANVIAGVAMEDGETIAAWLPEMEVEFGPAALLKPDTELKPSPSETSSSEYKDNFYDVPDVTIIGPDGKPLVAKYVGFDATTGLCIMRLTDKILFPPAALKVDRVQVGQNVLLLGPEPAHAQAMFASNMLVRMGALEGRIQNVLPSPSGEVARLTVSAPGLTQANIGGVALNEAGETIGIIDGLQGNGEATILPTASIRRAAQRVLEQQTSVPRPWLGVRGEAIMALNLNQILNHGWAQERAAALAGNDRGIMLTSVLPGSPAAKAELRAGDVILKVDDNEIRKAEDFTWWLEQAGSSNSVRFTVARPDRPVEEALNVKLSGLLDPGLRFNFRNFTRFTNNRGLSLLEHGIETIALRPLVASQLGTNAGLLVVFVKPGTPAFEAGLQTGDVIQSIDSKPVSAINRAVPLKAPSTLEIVRVKEKLTLKLTGPKQQ